MRRAERGGRRATAAGRCRTTAAALVVSMAMAVTASCASLPVDDPSPPAGTAPAGAEPVGTSPGTSGGSILTTDRTDPGGGACRGAGSTATRDVAYREDEGLDDPQLTLDLHRPVTTDDCGPVPLVVYVHGGGFTRGDKANRIEDKVALFTGEGWAFASVNYRLSPEPPAVGADPIRYPTHEQDVAAAIGWLAEHATDLGIDASQVLLIGHSSGAYLVSLLGTDTSFLRDAGVDPATVRCAVSLDTEYDAAAQVAQGGSQEALYRNALGDDPGTWAAASPIEHVADPGPHPRFLVITQGSPRRTAQARAFADALVANGTPATALEVSTLDHEGVNTAVGAPGDEVVTPAVLELFRSCVDPA